MAIAMTAPNPAANWVDDIIGLRLPDAPEVPIPKSNWIAHTKFVGFLIHHLRPRTIVEVGVYTGASLLVMRALAEWHGVACRVVGIDGWDGDDCGVEDWTWDGEETYQTLLARCASYLNVDLWRTRGEWASSRFDDGTIDLLHIDADHREANIRRDLAVWLPKLADAGVVLLHDVCTFRRYAQVWKVWGEITAEYPAYTDVAASGLGAFCPKGVRPGLADIMRLW